MTGQETLTRILAIDFGLKRIGLALCDPLKTFAYPYKTILNDGKLLDELKRISVEESICKIILGYPLKEDGSAAQLGDVVMKFKKEIEGKLNLEVLLVDERYSSLIAQEKIRQSVTKKSKRREKGLIDKNAAAIILQDFLDKKKG